VGGCESWGGRECRGGRKGEEGGEGGMEDGKRGKVSDGVGVWGGGRSE